MFGLEKLFGKGPGSAVETAEKTATGIGYEIRGGKFIWWFKYEDGSEGIKQSEEDFVLGKTLEENQVNIKKFEEKKMAELNGEEE